MGGWGALGAQFFSVWFVLVCFFASPVDSNHHEGSNSTVPAHEHKINADEQRVALLSLRQALGDPPQLTGWAEPGPCVGGQPIWVGITACSEDDLVQAIDLGVVTMNAESQGKLYSGEQSLLDVHLSTSDMENLLHTTHPETAVQEILQHNNIQSTGLPVRPVQIKDGNEANSSSQARVPTGRSSILEEGNKSVANYSNTTDLQPIFDLQISSDSDARNSSSSVGGMGADLNEMSADHSTPGNKVQRPEEEETLLPSPMGLNRSRDVDSQSRTSFLPSGTPTNMTTQNLPQERNIPVTVAAATENRTLPTQSSGEIDEAGAVSAVTILPESELNGLPSAAGVTDLRNSSKVQQSTSSEANATNSSSAPEGPCANSTSDLEELIVLVNSTATSANATVTSEDQGRQGEPEIPPSVGDLSPNLEDLADSVENLPDSSALREGNQAKRGSAADTNNRRTPPPVDDMSRTVGNSSDGGMNILVESKRNNENSTGIESTLMSEPKSERAEAGVKTNGTRDTLEEEVEIEMDKAPVSQMLDVDNFENELGSIEGPDDGELDDQLPEVASKLALSPDAEGTGFEGEAILGEELGEPPLPVPLENGEPPDEEAIEAVVAEEDPGIPASAPLIEEDFDEDAQGDGLASAPLPPSAGQGTTDDGEIEDAGDYEALAPESDIDFNERAMEEVQVEEMLVSGMGIQPAEAPVSVGSQETVDQMEAVSSETDATSPATEVSGEAEFIEEGENRSEGFVEELNSVGPASDEETALSELEDNLPARGPSQETDILSDVSEVSEAQFEENLQDEGRALEPSDLNPALLPTSPQNNSSEGADDIPVGEESTTVTGQGSSEVDESVDGPRGASETEGGNEGPVELECIQSEGDVDEENTIQCDLCSCLDDFTSQKCLDQAAVTCGIVGDNTDDCMTLTEKLASEELADFQDAAQVFIDSCPSLDVENADFCSCTINFNSAECRAGMLQLCDTNGEVCREVLEAFSDSENRDSFINRLVGEGSCGVGDSTLLLDIVLQNMSTDRFTPRLGRQLTDVVAEIGEVDRRSVSIIGLTSVPASEEDSNTRRLLQIGSMNALVLVDAGTPEEAEAVRQRITEAELDGRLRLSLAEVGLNLASAEARDENFSIVSREPNRFDVRQTELEDIPEGTIPRQGNDGLQWWAIVLIVFAVIIPLAFAFGLSVRYKKDREARIKIQRGGTPTHESPYQSRSIGPFGDPTVIETPSDSSPDTTVIHEDVGMRPHVEVSLVSDEPIPAPVWQHSSRILRRSTQDTFLEVSHDGGISLTDTDNSFDLHPARVVPPRPPENLSRLMSSISTDHTNSMDAEALDIAQRRVVMEADLLKNNWANAFDNHLYREDRPGQHSRQFSDVERNPSPGSEAPGPSNGFPPRFPAHRQS